MARTRIHGQQVTDGSIELVDLSSALASTISGKADAGDLAPVATSGSYNDLTDLPTSFSGAYADLTGKPTIPSALDDLSDVAVSSAVKGQFIVHNGTSFVNSNTIEASGAAVKPLIVKGAASQTANLFEVKNSSDVNLVAVDPDGGVNVKMTGTTTKMVITSHSSNLGNLFEFKYGGNNQNYGWIDANHILNWQNSRFYTCYATAVNYDITPLIAKGFQSSNNTAQVFEVQDSSATKLFQVNNKGAAIHTTTDASVKPLVVKGAASQTANLFEAQNSSGTALFTIDKDGSVSTGTVPVARVSGLATVATSGSYNDLSDKPSIPSLTGYATEAYVDAAVAGVDLSAVETRLDTLESDAFVTREVPSGLVDGSNAEFSLANTPVVGSEQVFVNGLLQESGAGKDYTISGDTITFATAPETGWKIHVSYATGSYLVAPGGASSSSGAEIYQDSEFTWTSNNTGVARTITHNKGRFPDMVKVFVKNGDSWVEHIDRIVYNGVNYGWDAFSSSSTANSHVVKLWSLDGGLSSVSCRIRLYWFSASDVGSSSSGWL